MAIIGYNRYGAIRGTGNVRIKRTTDKSYRSTRKKQTRSGNIFQGSLLDYARQTGSTVTEETLKKSGVKDEDSPFISLSGDTKAPVFMERLRKKSRKSEVVGVNTPRYLRETTVRTKNARQPVKSTQKKPQKTTKKVEQKDNRVSLNGTTFTAPVTKDKKLQTTTAVEFKKGQIRGAGVRTLKELQQGFPDPDPFKSTIKKAPKQTFSQKISKARDKNIQAATSDRSVVKRILKGTVGAAAFGAASGVVSAGTVIRHPIKFTASQYKALRNPKQTLKVIGTSFVKDPAGVVAEYYTFTKTLAIAGKGVKRSPFGQKVVKELYIRTKPKELQPALRKTLDASLKQQKIKGSTPKKVDFFEVKELNKIEARAAARALKNNPDTVVFGSVASRSLSGKKLPKPKDVDIAVKDVNVFYRQFISKLPKNQRSNYKLVGQKIKRVSDGTSIFDVKPISRLVPQKSVLTGKGRLPISGDVVYKGSKKSVKISNILDVSTQKPIKVKGVKMVTLGEQTLRKGLGTIQVLIEKNARRAKDPQSFVLSLEVQLKALKAQKAASKTQIGRSLSNQKIVVIQDTLSYLKSKDFSKLLEKKVPGITKEYPILNKLSSKKLKTALKSVDNIKKQTGGVGNIVVKNGKFINKNTGKVIKNTGSYLPMKATTSSLLPKIQTQPSSILPSNIPSGSKIMLKIPSSALISKIPDSKLTSVLKSSGVPSKVPTSRVPYSKTPTKTPGSKIPPRKLPPSKIPPSKTPHSKIPISRIPPITPSRLPPFKTPPSKLPPIRTPIPPKLPPKLKLKIEEAIKALKKKKKKKKLQVLFEYTPTIAGSGLKARQTQGKFTGFEVRGNIIRLKPVKVKRHKRKTLKNKAFVRKHRRKKPKK